MGDRVSSFEDAQLIRLSCNLLRMEDLTELSEALPSLVQVAFGARLVVLNLFSRGQFFSKEGLTGPLHAESSEGAELGIVEPRKTSVPLSLKLTARGKTCGYMLIHGGSLRRETAGQVEEMVSVALERAQVFGQTVQVLAARENARYRCALVDRLTQELRTPLTAIKGAATALLSGWSQAKSQLSCGGDRPEADPCCDRTA